MGEFKIKDVQISALKNIAEIFWEDGHISKFHSCWLRFNCCCEMCRKTIVGQQMVDRSMFSDQLIIENLEFTESWIKLIIIRDIIKDHVTYAEAEWLRGLCYCNQCLHRKISEKDMKFADPSRIPRVEFRDLETDEGTFRMLQEVFNVGFVVISGVPQEQGAVISVGQRFSPLIETTYGKLFDVQDLSSTENVTFSAIGLPFHTDQCNYEREPGIQALHAFRFDDCVEGGESLLVDMFQVIDIYRRESPDDFRVLTRIPVNFSTIDFGRKTPVYHICRKPIIQVDYDDQVVAFSWNPGTEDILQVHENDVEPFYRAYKKLERIIYRPELKFEFRLKEGDLLFFNNRRMVHSRRAYQTNGGMRHLQGAYFDIEDLRSKYVLLARKLGHNVIPPKMGTSSAI